jgi:hypothetical protein
MGTIVVVEPLPFLELLAQIYIIFVRQKLIEFLLIGSVRPFHFTIHLWGSGFDVDMPDPSVLDMPMELRLELMTPVCTNCMDAKRELLDGIVDEFNRAFLVVSTIDLHGSHARGVINGRVLKAPDSMAVRGLEA